MPRRRFVAPRPPKLAGGLPGETREERDRRVVAHLEANPSTTYAQAAKALGVPQNVISELGRYLAEKRDRGGVTAFLPPQQFMPGPELPDTPAERIAAIPPAERAAIAARYGCIFKHAQELAHDPSLERGRSPP